MPSIDIPPKWETAKAMQSVSPYFHELKISSPQSFGDDQGSAFASVGEVVHFIGTGGKGSGLLGFNFQNSQFHSFNVGETTIPVHTKEPAWTRSLRIEMLDFRAKTESEISRLSTAVETLTRSLSRFARDTYRGDIEREQFSHAENVEIVDVEDAAGVLNMLADLDLPWTAESESLAINNLADPKPTVRAAAARALAANAPALALEFLPDRISSEHNRSVRSILHGAMQAAKA